jgi:hypothetical protein
MNPIAVLFSFARGKSYGVHARIHIHTYIIYLVLHYLENYWNSSCRYVPFVVFYVWGQGPITHGKSKNNSSQKRYVEETKKLRTAR